MFGRIGPPEVILILAIVLIVFGVGKLPQVGESIGKGLRAFRKAQTDNEEDEVLKPTTGKAAAKKATKS